MSEMMKELYSIGLIPVIKIENAEVELEECLKN